MISVVSVPFALETLAGIVPHFAFQKSEADEKRICAFSACRAQCRGAWTDSVVQGMIQSRPWVARFDEGRHWRARIGFVLIATERNIEHEMIRLAPASGA